MHALTNEIKTHYSLNEVSNLTSVSVQALQACVKQFGNYIGMSHNTSKDEKLDSDTVKKLVQIVEMQFRGEPREAIIKQLRQKPQTKKTQKVQKTQSQISNAGLLPLFQMQSRLNKRMKVGTELVQHLQKQIQLNESRHKHEIEFLKAKVTVLTKALDERTRRFNEAHTKMEAKIEHQTSWTWVFKQFKTWLASKM